MATPKLHGRAFYESLGSPKYVLAPMVDQSEFAWRLLTRSFLPPDLRTSILAYSPMLHAKLFADSPKYRAAHFEPLKPPLALPQTPDEAHLKTLKEDDAYLDGNPKIDRPLFVQFCANDPQALLEAAKVVQPYCDAVDLNLGCPQGIAKRGHYGAFLQEDWDTIHKMISTLHKGLDIPVTAKMRILDTRERTLEYAQMLLNAGASIITVHGRQREQKGHNTGLADWSVLRYLRESLPPETVIFANGNILQHDDIQECLEQTKADGVMTAEGNLYDPSIFATTPPAGEEGREYWRGRDGKGGYRVDAVLRRYLDITHQYVFGQNRPARAPLFLPSDTPAELVAEAKVAETNGNKRSLEDVADGERPSKKQRKEEAKQQKKTGKQEKVTNANLVAMQAHCFHILRPLVSKHHNVRDALARSRAGDIEAYEKVLTLTEAAVGEGLLAYEANPAEFEEQEVAEAKAEAGPLLVNGDAEAKKAADECSDEAVRRCKRPYWVCQPYVRPLPKEALEKGSMQLSKKMKKKLEQEQDEQQSGAVKVGEVDELAAKAGVAPGGKVEAVGEEVRHEVNGLDEMNDGEKEAVVEVPKEGMVCG
ncbi:hypothetical protein LTR85_000170 [Meristemomyces frigidus]|nr:hypothetical protein LTR85_000170 [Meristemomyces frigidus]